MQLLRYGGAVLYTRAASTPAAILPRVTAAAERAGLDWSKFIFTDNSCRVMKHTIVFSFF